MLNNVYHLFARHSSFVTDDRFLKWLSRNGSAFWYETEIENGQSQVVVVSHDETSAWAALEKVDSGNDFPKPAVVRSVEVDLTALPSREDAIRAALQASGAPRKQVICAKPIIEFSEKTVRAEWVVELDLGAKAVNYGTESGLHERNRSIERNLRKPHLRPAIADDMATNELHSPYLFASEAEQWTQGPLTVLEKARRIAVNVSRTYRYDGSINLISEFTWADHLVKNRNGRRGICDEYAVVQISYLRSIGIPARLKFLIWQDSSGQGVGHACLEFSNGGYWEHMDGLWNAFQQPQVYRSQGARNLTVMDADYPSDARSTTPAWGQPDRTGDGLLYPYGDFLLNPGYPGNARPGYSY
jgi:hypothetical protein